MYLRLEGQVDTRDLSTGLKWLDLLCGCYEIRICIHNPFRLDFGWKIGVSCGGGFHTCQIDYMKVNKGTDYCPGKGIINIVNWVYSLGLVFLLMKHHD